MKSYINLSSFQLRIIAITTMIIDHIGTVFFPGIAMYKIIGRVSFPIFAFLIVEGSIYTSNIKAYRKRLLCFALLSEIPFNLAFYGEIIYLGTSNVLFTLYAGLLTIDIIKNYHDEKISWLKLFLIALVIQLIGGDYLIYGILTVIIFYNYRGQIGKIYMALLVLFFILMGGLQVYGIFALGILYFYNGNEGKKLGRLFYLLYPVHLLIIYGVYILG